MRRTAGLIVSLGLVLVLTSTVMGAERATMESVSIRYTTPQEAHILYTTGDLPTRPVLVQEVTRAVCLSIAEAEQFSREAGREFAEPLKLPLTVRVEQYVGSSGRFHTENRGEVVVKRCVGKEERDT